MGVGGGGRVGSGDRAPAPRNYPAVFALGLRVGAHGGRALMRIGPIFPVMVAMTLIAAAVGVHAAGSGLAEEAARSAQPRQLAQTPEQSPPATEQPESENPPSAPPAPPGNIPSPYPPSGTPAMVFDDQEVSTILGKSVRSGTGEDMGRIIDIIVSRDGQVHAAIIDFGGFLGRRSRQGAVHWAALNFSPPSKP